jgi:glycosyltransferase involved in cell wall biosynthesis
MTAPPGPLRVLALVPRPANRHANTRFRLEQWMPYLEHDHGIRVTLSPYESPELADLLDAPGRRGRKLAYALRDLGRRWARRHEVLAYDAAIVVHEASMLGGAWLERWIARHGVPFVYDFDDPLWVTVKEFGDWTTRLWRSPLRSLEISRLATVVTVGNEFLADAVRGVNANVRVVYPSIDLARYQVLPYEDDGKFTVVWTGQRGASMRFLDTVRPALERLGERMPVKLRVISDEAPPPHRNVEVEYVPWSAAVEVSALGAGDVGIMPLPDTPAARGKCALKALQYMAVGRAAVISPVGINADVVREGDNGLWATTEDDWLRQLERLARDPELRQRLANAGRRTVEQRFSAEISARAFASAVRDAAATRGR